MQCAGNRLGDLGPSRLRNACPCFVSLLRKICHGEPWIEGTRIMVSRAPSTTRSRLRHLWAVDLRSQGRLRSARKTRQFDPGSLILMWIVQFGSTGR